MYQFNNISMTPFTSDEPTWREVIVLTVPTQKTGIMKVTPGLVSRLVQLNYSFSIVVMRSIELVINCLDRVFLKRFWWLIHRTKRKKGKQFFGIKNDEMKSSQFVEVASSPSSCWWRYGSSKATFVWSSCMVLSWTDINFEYVETWELTAYSYNDSQLTCLSLNYILF